MTCTCGARDTHHASYCALAGSCPRGCLEGECYCAEPTRAEIRGECAGCGGEFGDCYCGED